MTNDLHGRAMQIFGSSSDGIFWPYDVSGIDRTLRRTAPDRYRQQLDLLTAKREVIVTWAEQYGLKASRVHCCPNWLTRKVSRRCHLRDCHYGRQWLDHGICWLKDGRPAVITSAPYSLQDEDKAHVEAWLQRDARLAYAYGAGWYGYGTQQVVMWRTDRITRISPATPRTGATP